MDNKLLKLDFAPGIKASDINHNFDVIHGWITRERLRVAGYGIVEGFDLSADLNNFTVTVGEGIIINDEGEEVYIPSETFSVGPPEYITEEEEITCPEDGILVLKYRPYSSNTYGYINYIPPNEGVAPLEVDLKLQDLNTALRVPIMQVINNKVYVNQNSWAGHKIKVTYKHTNDRVDAIMLYKDGTYKYEKSIESTSPSHVELGDYIHHFCIGVVYWKIDTSISVEFFINHRSYRPVYVDKGNHLYLNGELYVKPKFIYFVEPENPEENDLWYDAETNTLYIWREYNGDWGWVAVNDFSTSAIREHKIWTPDSFPEDNQTFMFNEDETNLFYVPDTSSLEIIIDNAPLMSDQFEEIIVPNDKEYLSDGRGFRLKDPLDRATYVECIVHHNVKNKPLRETFQRAAIFIAENYEYYSPDNTAKLFKTVTEYVIGEDQLEIFVDGIRLTENIDFVEMIDDNTEATETDRKKMSSLFKIKSELQSGQLITHKISKHVWSYDHLDMMVHDIEDKADNALEQCKALRTDLTSLNDNTVYQLDAIKDIITQFKNDVGDLTNYLKKDSILTTANIPQNILNRLVSGQLSGLYPTTQQIILNNVKDTDFVVVSYISERLNRTLIKDTEYTLTTLNSDVRIDLDSGLIASDANIYVQVLKVGDR